MARKNRDSGGGGDEWMNTYADMVTLLLTFFIMLFSMSSVNAEKWEMLIQAFTNRGNETSQVVFDNEQDGEDLGTLQSKAGGGENLDLENTLPVDFDELFEYLQAYVEENRMEGSVEVSKSEGTIFIRFRNNIFFDGDKYNLKQSSHGILDFLGRCLKSVEDQIMTINISGHTAAIPWDEDYRVNDRMLSLQRAGVVAVYLEEQTSLDPTKILPTGYGKYFPVASNDTEDGRQRNRRVDMMIISNDGSISDREILERMLKGTYDMSQYPGSGSAGDVLIPNPERDANSDVPIDMDRAARELEERHSGIVSSETATFTPSDQSSVPAELYTLPETAPISPDDPAEP